MSRAREARAARRAAQFSKFHLTQLNLVPLVDTFVSIVFFALTTSTVGALSPVVPGVRLPDSRVGAPAFQQITLGVGAQVTLGGRPVMSTADAARARSTNPQQPLLIPALYTALSRLGDSLRVARRVPAGEPVGLPLAIQGDRTMRYALLARMMQTARLAGFRDISLQVNRTGTESAVPAGGTESGAPAGGTAPAAGGTP